MHYYLNHIVIHIIHKNQFSPAVSNTISKDNLTMFSSILNLIMAVVSSDGGREGTFWKHFPFR